MSVEFAEKFAIFTRHFLDIETDDDAVVGSDAADGCCSGDDGP